MLIGVALAFLLNLFHGNRSHKKVIIENMRYTEQQLQEILERLAVYLSGKNTEGVCGQRLAVWRTN